ncbi:hypothetical protein NSQ26_14365 [Bacillus sp. FSL W7-1360]
MINTGIGRSHKMSKDGGRRMKGQFDYKEKMQRNKRRRTNFVKRMTALTLAATVAVSVPAAGTAFGATTDAIDEGKSVEKVVDVLTKEDVLEKKDKVTSKGEKDETKEGEVVKENNEANKGVEADKDVKKDDEAKAEGKVKAEEETKTEEKTSEEVKNESQKEDSKEDQSKEEVNPEPEKVKELSELIFGEDFIFDVVHADGECEVVFTGPDLEDEMIDVLFEEWFDSLSEEEYDMYFGECDLENGEEQIVTKTKSINNASGEKSTTPAVAKVSKKEANKQEANKQEVKKTSDGKKEVKKNTKPKTEVKAKEGKKLPNTATDTGMYAVAGTMAVLLGFAVKLISRVRRTAL